MFLLTICRLRQPAWIYLQHFLHLSCRAGASFLCPLCTWFEWYHDAALRFKYTCPFFSVGVNRLTWWMCVLSNSVLCVAELQRQFLVFHQATHLHFHLLLNVLTPFEFYVMPLDCASGKVEPGQWALICNRSWFCCIHLSASCLVYLAFVVLLSLTKSIDFWMGRTTFSSKLGYQESLLHSPLKYAA